MTAIATSNEIVVSALVESEPGSVRKIKKAIAHLMLLANFGIASNVLANDCANEDDSLAITACHAARCSAADKELNRFYTAALNELSETEKQKLIEAQRAWIRYRDAGVALMIEINKDARSYGSIVVGDYKATIVEKRVKELKHMFASPADPPVSW